MTQLLCRGASCLEPPCSNFTDLSSKNKYGTLSMI